MSTAALLLRLQETDLELMRAQHELEHYQQKEKMSQFLRAEKKLAKETLKVVGLRKDLEIDLQDKQEQITDLHKKAKEVQESFTKEAANFRAIKDFELQLSNLAKQIEKLQFESAQITADLDRVQQAEHKAYQLKDKLTAEKQALQDTIDKNSADVLATINELEDSRACLVAQIENDTYETYTQASGKYRGLCVEKLDGNTPSICRVSLQPAQFQELKKASINSVVTCPYCRRMLVVSEQEQELTDEE